MPSLPSARRKLLWQETERAFTEEKTEDAGDASITMTESTSLFTAAPTKKFMKR